MSSNICRRLWIGTDILFPGLGLLVFGCLVVVDASPFYLGAALLAWGWTGRLMALRSMGAMRMKYEEKAMIDAGTGALSKNRLIEALEREMKASKRKQTSLSIVMVEATNITEINRKFDRIEGDASLAAVAMGAQNCLRDTDYLGRSSGLTFCALLPETKNEEALVVRNRISASISDILRSHSKGEVRIQARLMHKTWDGEDSWSDFLAKAEHELLEGDRCGGLEGLRNG